MVTHGSEHEAGGRGNLKYLHGISETNDINHSLIKYNSSPILMFDSIFTPEKSSSPLLHHFIPLIAVSKDIDLVVNIRKTKYMEVGRHRGIIENEHVTVGSNVYKN